MRFLLRDFMMELSRFWILLAVIQTVVHVDGRATSVFRDFSSDGQLRNFVFDTHTNSIYVGAVNMLYWLSGELRLMNSLDLGPLDDHVNCSINVEDHCAYGRVAMPAINQALTIDAKNRVLLVCSTLYHGSCRTIDMRTFVPNNYFLKPVTSNDPNGSTVMFIGPGIEAGGVLYVATSYSSIGLPALRNSVSMISVRNIYSLDLSWKSSAASSSINISLGLQKNFPLKFVGGFHHRNYIYFFVNHPDSMFYSGSQSSFVMRICKNDTRLQSFIEIPIECKIGGMDYQYLRDVTLGAAGTRVAESLKITSDVVYGVFTEDFNNVMKESAVCAYSMDDIERRFQETIQKCFNGSSFTGPAFITKPTLCARKNVRVPQDFCGNQDTNYPLSGSVPIGPISTAFIRDAVASSILVKVVEKETVVFAGTHSGTVVKLLLKSRENLSPIYGTDKLKQDVVQPVKDLVFGLNNNIFVLTDSAVYSLKTFDCGFANTCNKCVEDPHCGWCLTSKRCCTKSLCNSSSFWVSETCPLIVGLSQPHISRDKYSTSKLVVTVNVLPESRKTVECQMEDRIRGSSELSQSVVGAANIVTCQPFRNAPQLPDNRTHVSSQLTVLVDKVPWVTTSLNVFNCSRLLDCGSCTTTIFSCKWCASRHRCLAMADECSTASGVSASIDQSLKCPSVEFPPEKSSYLMASGTKKSFSVVGYNILKIYQDKLKCLFRIGDQIIKSPASFKATEAVALTTVITCNTVELNYSGVQPFISVPLDVVWDGDAPLDKSKNLQIRLYKCRHLVSSCGQCLTSDVEYRCGWCGDHCSLEKDCTKGWTNRDFTCPNPRIMSFSPPGGPTKGGTRLTVKGVNLGVAASELLVNVGGEMCRIIPHTYVPSESFTCITGAVRSTASGIVVVKIKGQLTATAPTPYQYKDPVLFGLSPRRGPLSGGSLMRVNGMNLDYGGSLSVTLNQKPVQILFRNATQIAFLTPLQSAPTSAVVKLRVDDGSEIATKDHFIYVEDPSVSSVDPKMSLISGGNVVDIRGSHLNSVLNPSLIVYHGRENRTGPCKVSGSSFLQCFTPDLRDVDLLIEQSVQLEFGLVMDNVTNLLNVQNLRNVIKPLTYFPAPSIQRFASPIKYKKGATIAIQGKNIDNLKKFHDLTVTVGGVKCDIVENGDDSRLTFEPPENPSVDRSSLAQITVQVGNFREDVGYVNYKTFPLRLVLGLVLGAGFVLIASVILLVVCVSRKSRQRYAAYKKSPPELQDLEDTHERAQCNSYSENNPCGTEAVPLKSSPSGNKDVENDDDDVFDEKCDLKGGEVYFQGLLKRVDNPALRKAAKDVFISRERIELGNLLGRGHFGQVFAATLRDEEMKDPMHVAVKTVEDAGLNPKVVESFLKEGVIMKKFDHPHVLSLLGISLGLKKEPMVVLPFMANGDLRSYVKDKSREFTARQLLSMAQQVAEGMTYLSSLNFIHRDLAARNCMIDDKNQVKVADFGLSHELYDREYYSSRDRRAKLPIKWMALESLEDFIFTTKSDVWSFGVLMWELMTRGVTPYPDVEIFETRNYLASGRRLRKPKYCPDDIYNIMLECWNKIPERRPAFAGLVNQIEVLLNPSKPLLKSGRGSDTSDEPAYMNVTEQEQEADYLKPTNLTYNYSSC